MQKILRTGELRVDELALELDVSPSTIRRSLKMLEQEGLLKRTHGGAVRIEPMLYEPFRHVSTFHEQELNRADENAASDSPLPN